MTASATERAADYHADHGDGGPTLTSSIARLLIERTPAHAKAAHPKLAAQPARRDSPAMDMGTAVHQLLLRDDRVDVIPFDEWRTNEAKALVARSREAGRVPMKPQTWAQAQEVAERVREQILDLNVDPVPFTEGEAEHTIRFTCDGAECRAMLDWLRTDRQHIDDLKTTGLTADPRTWARKLFNAGYDIQAAFYTRAVQAEYGATPVFRWVVVETSPPYPVSIVTLSDEAMESAQAKVSGAIATWNECLQSGEWPAYTRDLFVAELPPWMRTDPWARLDVDLDEVPF